MCILKNKKVEKKLYCLLTELGYDFSNYKKNKSYRITFQKLVYAMQRNGFNFGFSYNLYINGPYCPELASKGYEMVANIEELENDDQPFILSATAKVKLQQVRMYLNNRCNDSDWLEIIATLDFLCNEFFAENTQKEIVFNKFSQIKPGLYGEYGEVALEEAWGLIKGVQ